MIKINGPRIRGRVGQIEDPPDLKGKWTFEIHVSPMGRDDLKHVLHGPVFATEKEAHVEMQSMARSIAQDFEKSTTGKISGQYLDLKTNQFRNWEEH